MELGLSLGDGVASKSLRFMEKSHPHEVSSNKGLGFSMGLSIGSSGVRGDANDDDHHQRQEEEDDDDDDDEDKEISTPTENTITGTDQAKKATNPPKGIQLIDLLPNTPVVVPRSPKPSYLAFPWASDNVAACACSSGQMARGFDVNKFPFVEESHELDGATSPKSNNSAASSFQMDFCMYSNNSTASGENNINNNNNNNKRDFEIDGETERGSSRAASDEDENGSTRKKLRLSKEQSAFLEESFKEHNTLNPKQKLALANQLNLRPRQVEVWFQNRRARTKLKQTEVDCEYLKRCCETLTEENRRLQKELQELRALKTTSNPFYMQLPATTLTMCPSCERVATTTNPPATTTNSTSDPSTGFSLNTSTTTTTRPRFFPFSPQNQSHAAAQQQQLEKK